MIKNFVDLRRISCNVRDVVIDFDSRPERIINHKSILAEYFGFGSDTPTCRGSPATKEENEEEEQNDKKDNKNTKPDVENKEEQDKDDKETKSENIEKNAKNEEKNEEKQETQTYSRCGSNSKNAKKTEYIHTATFKLIPSINSNDNTSNNDTTNDNIEEKKQKNDESTDEDIHVVLAHGYGCGLCIFVPAIDHIFDELLSQFTVASESDNDDNKQNSKNDNNNNSNSKSKLIPRISLHLIDWLGCGASSKPKFLCKDTAESEHFFIESLEAWRKAMNIDKMILAGHSIGGYCSAAYSLRYPQNVANLLLLSPAGVNDPPPGFDDRSKYRWSWRFLISVVEGGLTPFDIVRMAGPKGKEWVYKMVEGRYNRSPNMRNTPYGKKLVPLLAEYLYQITYGNGSGENCLNKILTVGAYAQNPLYWRLPQLHKLNSNMTIDFMYGKLDWMDVNAAIDLKNKQLLKCEVYEVDKAGHQISVENRQLFAKIFVKILKDRIVVQ